MVVRGVRGGDQLSFLVLASLFQCVVLLVRDVHGVRVLYFVWAGVGADLRKTHLELVVDQVGAGREGLLFFVVGALFDLHLEISLEIHWLVRVLRIEVFDHIYFLSIEFSRSFAQVVDIDDRQFIGTGQLLILRLNQTRIGSGAGHIIYIDLQISGARSNQNPQLTRLL